MLRWILGSAALAIALLLAFVVIEQNPAQPVAEGYFYTGAYPSKPENLNPFTTRHQVARRSVLGFTHDALMDWDPETGKLREALATVDARPDGVTFVFTLREGLRFSDGVPVTMEDVLFTWEVRSDPTVPLGTMGDDLAGVKDVKKLPGSPERLQIVLAEPLFPGLQSFAPSWTVVQKRYFLGEIEGLAGRSILPGEEGFGQWLAAVELPGPGTGPYRLEEHVSSREVPWQAISELRLVQNPGSWRRRECRDCWGLDGFHLLFMSDPVAMLEELLAGNLSWYYEADPDGLLEDYPELADRYEVYEYDYRNLGHYWIVWNGKRRPFDRVEVRRALSMLFDRDMIVSEFLHGTGQIATAFFKPGMASYPAGNPVPFDVDGARTLLQEAGFGPGGEALSVEILWPSETSFYRRVLAMASTAFADAGIDLVPKGVPYSTLEARLRDHSFDGAIFIQHHGAWVDPYPFFHSSQKDFGKNYMGYVKPDVDRILEQARREMDDDRRAELYRLFNTIIQDEQPVTFLAHPLASMLIDARIQGVKEGPLGLFPERWWVER